MKKIALILAAALIAVTSIFCFAGCGETPEQKLANYIASDTCQKDIDTLKSSFGSTLDIDVKAEGENVVFTFAYKTDLPEESLDTVKSTLETGFDSNLKALLMILKMKQVLTIHRLLLKLTLRTARTFSQRLTTQQNNLIACNLRTVTRQSVFLFVCRKKSRNVN